jgi:hypothetical protein
MMPSRPIKRMDPVPGILKQVSIAYITSGLPAIYHLIISKIKLQFEKATPMIILPI